jgi:hypothetical protein
MQRIFTLSSLALLTATLFFAGCKKSDTLTTEEVNSYYPMTVGKYITYRLDSTNYIGYTITPTLRTYYVRDLVEAQITDNLNRRSFRVVRFIKDSLSQPTWRNSNTFMVTPLERTIEYVENNLRYVRLQNPVKDGFTWPGNSYIEANGPLSPFQFMAGWEYQYENINGPYTVFSTTVPNTITVRQADELDGTPNDPSGYSERNYSVEVFAKSLGLIYKEFLHWSYQPPQSPLPGYRTGYGVKLTMIDHN